MQSDQMKNMEGEKKHSIEKIPVKSKILIFREENPLKIIKVKI